jgi:uncharacterized protein YndB with AHSA1/START domain
MSTTDPLDIWALDREIMLAVVVAAPRERVFAAWTGVHHLVRWFGPEGFTVDSRGADVRAGGQWQFDYVSPDGTRYGNRIAFRDIAVPSRLVFDHGPDQDDAPERFRVTVTLDAQEDGKTVVTLRQLHPSPEQRDATIGFGAVELGYQTLDKLARHVASDA